MKKIRINGGSLKNGMNLGWKKMIKSNKQGGVSINSRDDRIMLKKSLLKKRQDLEEELRINVHQCLYVKQYKKKKSKIFS